MLTRSQGSVRSASIMAITSSRCARRYGVMATAWSSFCSPLGEWNMA